jgi:alkylated DNA repair protein (DNA oxidative demethylase)
MRPLRSLRRRYSTGSVPQGQRYDPEFVAAKGRAEIVSWLSTLYPLWEERFSPHHPPPKGQAQRRLLRPVYWLGNWQFACLDYYRPPHGVEGRCVRAEPFPPVLARLVADIELQAHAMFEPADVPKGWHLNTCLVNFYGSRLEGGKRVDTARVGEHRDFEPGPVASISLGERALFQFVRSQRPGERDAVVSQTWLDDSSLQIFGGERWKRHHFHRVQRVETKGGHRFALNVIDFETRRVNFTFRYVPDQHVIPFARLSAGDRADVRGYMETLAQRSPFFAAELARGSP